MRLAHTSCIVSFNREVLFFARSQFKVVVIQCQWHTIFNYSNMCDNMSQGGNFIKVGLSIDDPNFPCSQGIKRVEVRYMYIINNV